MEITVYTCKDYGGEMVDSVSGGYGTEYWVVRGCAWRELGAAQAAGLPKKGDLNPDSAFKYVGRVQHVGGVHSWGPLLWLAIVHYSAGGTFNLTTKLGSRLDDHWEDVDLPIIRHGPAVGPPMFGAMQPPCTIKRYGFIRTETRLWTDPIEDVQRYLTRNINKMYQFGILWQPGSPFSSSLLQYQLRGATMVTDSNNNTRIDTTFISRTPIRAIAADTAAFGGNNVAVPELGANCDYSANTINGSIGIIDPFERYGPGEVLPWLV